MVKYKIIGLPLLLRQIESQRKRDGDNFPYVMFWDNLFNMRFNSKVELYNFVCNRLGATEKSLIKIELSLNNENKDLNKRESIN